MNFSTVPPKRSSSERSARGTAESIAAHVLGIELLGARGEADEVAEEHGDDLALLARLRRRVERSRALPEQKRASSVFSWPQLGQFFTRGE